MKMAINLVCGLQTLSNIRKIRLMKSSFVVGNLSHKRFQPTANDFTFKHCMVFVDLKQLSEDRLPWFIRSNRPGIFSIHSNDYINESDSSIYEKVESLFEESKSSNQQFDWFMMATPKCSFYSFNPASFYFGVDQVGALTLGAVEVHNTFGESHIYKLTPEESDSPDSLTGIKPKVFHVSPFIEDVGEYRMYIKLTDKEVDVEISLSQNQETVITTNFSGFFDALGYRSFCRHFLKLVIAAFLTEVRILKEAYLLFFRLKLKFVKKPKLRPGSRKSPSKGFISRLKLPF